MSGPPYPRPTISTSAIGSFKIGVSPIGEFVPFDYWKTVISQYANSPIITALITDSFEWLDQSANIEQFFNLVYDISIAVGWGLDVWGRRVGVRRTYQKTSTDRNLGFNEATTANADPFGQSPFFSGPTTAGTFSLNDDAFRNLILAKATANVCDGSIKAINSILMSLFPLRGDCYVADGLDMTMSYTFTFPLSDEEYAMLAQSQVLPKSAGVSATFVLP